MNGITGAGPRLDADGAEDRKHGREAPQSRGDGVRGAVMITGEKKNEGARTGGMGRE